MPLVDELAHLARTRLSSADVLQLRDQLTSILESHTGAPAAVVTAVRASRGFEAKLRSSKPVSVRDVCLAFPTWPFSVQANFMKQLLRLGHLPYLDEPGAPLLRPDAFPPEQLEYAITAQMQRESFTKRNNEMVVDLSSVAPRLPGSIEGFFYVAGAPDYKENEARDAHARFREYYEMHPQGAPPLMVVDMSKPRPFVLDTSLAELADVIPY